MVALDLSYQQFQKHNKTLTGTIIDKYIIYQKVGNGSYGAVYKAMNDENKKIVAIKLLNLVSIEQDQSSKKVREIRKRLARTQSQLMMKVKSDHVMKLYDVYQNKCFKILACQFCNEGTLYQQLMKRKRIPEPQAIQIIKQIILGLAEMHKQNIIHRDLKSDNIMSHNGVFKIIDLGFARMIPAQTQIAGTVLGTIVTMAPELMRRQKYGLKADIWSIGIILYQIIYGCLPYQPMTTSQMYDQIIKKDIFNNKNTNVKPSVQVVNLLKKLLVVDQYKRIGWEQLINLQIFKDKKQLPNQFILRVSLDKIKQSGIQIIPQRTQEQEFKKLQKTKYDFKKQKSTGVKPTQISQNEITNKIKEADKTQQKMVEWVFINYLQCLKTKLIYYQIIKQIQKNNLLDFHDRKVIEFMYLISSRCYVNISVVKQQFADSHDPLILSIKNSIGQIDIQIHQTFNYYSKRLTLKENKVTSIIQDRFQRIFNSDDMKIKDKFLTGVQPCDYSKQQQIQYTYNKYIVELIGVIQQKNIQIYNKLYCYRQINYIKRQNLKNGMLFNVKVQQIISENHKKRLSVNKG